MNELPQYALELTNFAMITPKFCVFHVRPWAEVGVGGGTYAVCMCNP